MKPKKNYLNRIYDREAISGAFIIEAALHQYRDIFNEWDPVPFKRRDLNPDLYLFLEECSSDIPLKYPLILLFHIPREEKNPHKEELIKSGFKTYFSFAIHLISKEIKSSNKRILRYILTAVVFLFSAFGLEKIFAENVFTTILLEGLFIGGWVFLWEAFSTFSFTKKEIYLKLKIAKRFLQAGIRFKYEQ